MTIVPFNDTSRIFNAHKKEIMSALSNVAQSGWWLLGRHTQAFSEQFAIFCGVKFCLPVANGSDALELALRSVLDPKNSEENEVITVANAGGYASIACRLVGATPVYADIDATTLLISMESLKNCLGPKVKAVIVTHLFGGAVDVIKVRQVLVQNGYSYVSIIEDCAQAHGAKVGNARIGSLGDVATFSFYPTKNLGGMGDGGAIVTSNEVIYNKIEKLHQYGWGKKYQVDIPFGRNSRIDEMQAVILSCLLPSLDSNNLLRKKIYSRYQEAGGNNIQFLEYENNDYVGHLAVILTNQQDELTSFMKKRNITVDVHYPVLDNEQMGWKDLPMRQDAISNLATSRRIVNKIISLPCFPTMTELEICTVCEALHIWGKKR